MSLSTRGLLALGATAAMASALGVLAFDTVGGPDAGPSIVPSAAQAAAVFVPPIPPPVSPEPADRFAFVTAVSLETGSLALRPSLDDPALREKLETGSISPWSVETRPIVTVPIEPPRARVALIEPPRLATPPRVEPQAAPTLQRVPRMLPVPRPAYQTPALQKRLAEISPAANRRLVEKFEAAKMAWPPAEVALVTIKDAKIVELHARTKDGPWTAIHRYPVLAASGGAGPKLRQGDKQVPEGVYNISFLNPLSAYHVSMRVNYPNAFDRKVAAADGRKDLGGDIMFHGKAVSAGCIAVGDPAIEELFVLAAHVGTRNIRVVIAPTDFRAHGLPQFNESQPNWLPKLYAEVASAMSEFKGPPKPPSLLSSFFGN